MPQTTAPDHPGYAGRILNGAFTPALKERVSRLLGVLHDFEATAAPVLMYVSAWRHTDDRDIWYEFAGRRFLDLFGCPPGRLPEVFRESVLDQRVYRMADVRSAVHLDEIGADRLDEERGALRAGHTAEGGIDAVYQVRCPDGSAIWLKDLATVEVHPRDRICLSVGNLTPVTKEMRSEAERMERERLQVSLEMAGAVCHELNQPIQGISGYAETLLEALDPAGDDHRRVRGIRAMTDRMAAITRKLMKITRYETKDYLQGVRIVDIDRSSEER